MSEIPTALWAQDGEGRGPSPPLPAPAFGPATSSPPGAQGLGPHPWRIPQLSTALEGDIRVKSHREGPQPPGLPAREEVSKLSPSKYHRQSQPQDFSAISHLQG